MLPANAHRDARTITYDDYQHGDRDYAEASKYNKGSAAEAKQYTVKTLAAIKSGKLDKNKR